MTQREKIRPPSSDPVRLDTPHHQTLLTETPLSWHPHTYFMHTDRLTPQAESLCGQERLYSSCSHLPTLSPEMCVYQTHTHRQPANRECCVTRTICSLSLMLCHCFSPYTVNSCRPGDSPLICSTTFNIQVAALSHFVSDLMTHMSGNYCSNLYTVNKVVLKV